MEKQLKDISRVLRWIVVLLIILIFHVVADGDGSITIIDLPILVILYHLIKERFKKEDSDNEQS